MIIPALVLSVLTQTAQLAPDYSVPIGASSEFHHLVIDIEKALVAKDYTKAEKLSLLLPRPTVSVRIDDSKLNDDQKIEFDDAIATAAKIWEQNFLRQVTISLVKTAKADISFSFEPILAKINGTDQVAGATWFLAAEPTQPYIETVIGLKRGPKFEKVLGREVYNESLFTFGRYFGLAPHPLMGTAMGRVEGQMANPSVIVAQEIQSAKKILTLAENLRTAIRKRQSIDVGHPNATIEKKTLVFDTQLQGDEGRSQLLVTNTGTAPLELSVRGDCGCITGAVAPILEPGKSTLLTGIYNTTELVGDIHHNLVLRTNDPDQPSVIIPSSISVTPRAESVFPDSNTTYLDGSQTKFTFYINSAEPKVFGVIDSALTDKSLSMKLEPFQGEVTNFTKSGQKQVIRGYKVTVDTSKYPAAALFGRAAAMAYIRTDNPKMSVVKILFYLQKGIVALPESIYLGSPRGVADAMFVISRPGRPFVIKKISSDSKFLSFQTTKVEAMRGSEYYVKVLYDGKAAGHKFKSVIIIETDDPKQSVIRIPIQTSGV